MYFCEGLTVYFWHFYFILFIKISSELNNELFIYEVIQFRHNLFIRPSTAVPIYRVAPWENGPPLGYGVSPASHPAGGAVACFSCASCWWNATLQLSIHILLLASRGFSAPAWLITASHHRVVDRLQLQGTPRQVIDFLLFQLKTNVAYRDDLQQSAKATINC